MGVGEGAALFMSGSRIRARYLDATDGTRQFIEWFDTKRDEVCEFTRVDENCVYRCFPMQDVGGSSVGYDNSSCTSPGGWTDIVFDPKGKKYFNSGAFNAACQGIANAQLHAYGAKFNGTVYEWKPGPVCAPVNPQPASAVYITLVPSSEFVGASVTTE